MHGSVYRTLCPTVIIQEHRECVRLLSPKRGAAPAVIPGDDVLTHPGNLGEKNWAAASHTMPIPSVGVCFQPITLI